MARFDSKRALRRHHLNRIKKNRKFYWGRELNEEELGIVAKTTKTTKCACCGNPRRYFGKKTLQEKRAEQDYR